MNNLVDIIKYEGSDNICYLSKDILNAFSLIPGKSYSLKFGWRKTRVKIRALDTSPQTILKASTDTFTRLCLPEELKTGIIFNKGEIELGPVMGVLVNYSYVRDLKNQSPRPSSVQMLKLNKKSHLFIYFFSLDGADWIDKKIEGWYYSKASKAWMKKWLPLPDVVYDRGVGFGDKDKQLLYHFRDQFTPAGSIIRINSSDCLDKYWVYEKIKHHKNIQKYLPDTEKFRTIDELLLMLKKYGTIYLKSFYGSCGIEVMAVKLYCNNAIECSYFESDIFKRKVIYNTSDLSKLINYFFKDKQFIVQQGVDLIEYGGSRLDMRVLIQKDGKGKWISVYNVVIKGRSESLINGDERIVESFLNFNEYMPAALNMPISKVESLNRDIEQACFNIAMAIEDEYGPFGEIGMDMALDKNLKIWFIEANSKPDRELETGSKGIERLKASCRYIIDYARYLSGFC